MVFENVEIQKCIVYQIRKYSDYIRKNIYTSNPIEWFNRQIRKYTKNKCIFPNEDALMRLVYLAMDIIVKME